MRRWHRRYPRPVLWVVTSPAYETYGEGWYDPPELGRDFLYVFTRSARDAKRLAIRAWRRHWRKGCHSRRTLTPREPYIVRYDDENPLVVVNVRRICLVGAKAEV